MADFGALFEQIKDRVIEDRQAAAEAKALRQREADDAFAKAMLPITTVLDPVLLAAKSDLNEKGIFVEVDQCDALSIGQFGKPRRKHFQLTTIFDIRSRFIVMTIENNCIQVISCDGQVPNLVQRKDEAVYGLQSFTTANAELLIKQLLEEIVPQMVPNEDE